jgi:hypothetical protein
VATFKIQLASRLEDDTYERILGGIPAGRFYLLDGKVRPRWNGATYQNFVLSGTQGNLVAIYLNGALATTVAMDTEVSYFKLKLSEAPTINYIRAIDGYRSGSQWIATGDEDGATVVLTNFASVHYGMARQHYQRVWLPYLYQKWSVESEWGSRLIEWAFKYRYRFPDTQALRTLAARLTSRSVWHEQPTSQGVKDAIAAICCSEPVIRELSNNRSYQDLALWPPLPVTADYSGWEFNVWLPDIPTAKEVGTLLMANNLTYLAGQQFVEPNFTLSYDDEMVQLHKREQNLAHLLQQIGPMDAWQCYVAITRLRDLYFRWWDNALDNTVATPGLGSGTPWDVDGGTWDSGALDSPEPFADLWDGVGVNDADELPTVTWDSVIQVTKGEDEVPPDDPPCWQWEYSTLSPTVSTCKIVTNPLHGGAPASYEA